MVDFGLFIPNFFLTILPIFCMIWTGDVFGSTNTHIFAFFVSIPSPIVAQEAITMTSSFGVSSNFSNVFVLDSILSFELNPIIFIFLYILFVGNSALRTFLNALINSALFTKLFTDVSLSVFTYA